MASRAEKGNEIDTSSSRRKILATRGGLEKEKKKKKKKKNQESSTVFVSDLAAKKFDLLKSIPHVPGRYVNFSEILVYGYDVIDLFQEQGLIDFLTLKNNYYPDLVREFYANLGVDNIDHPTSFKTMVKGVEMIVTPETLGDLFGLENDGVDYYEANFKTFKVSRVEVMRTLVGDVEYERLPVWKSKKTGISNLERKDVRTSSLKPMNKIILSILESNLVPKSGKFDEISENRAIITLAVSLRIKVNWAKYIFQTMIDEIKGNIPYGRLITKIMKINEIDLLQEEPGKPEHDFDTTTLKRMKLPERNPTEPMDVEREWSVDREEFDEEEEEDEEKDENYEAFTKPIAQDWSYLCDKIEDLDMNVYKMKDSFKEFKSMVENRLDQMGDNLKTIKDLLQRKFSD